MPYALLGILSRGPGYGYELKQTYDRLFAREKPLAFGQVYATLSRLFRDQKVTIETIEQQAGPERKKYAITDLGRKELEEWLMLPEKLAGNLSSVLFAKVVATLLTDKSPHEFLDAQRTAHIAAMRELTRQRREGNLKQLLQADYALFHLEADLRWIDVTSERIETLRQELQNACE